MYMCLWGGGGKEILVVFSSATQLYVIIIFILGVFILSPVFLDDIANPEARNIYLKFETDNG